MTDRRGTWFSEGNSYKTNAGRPLTPTEAAAIETRRIDVHDLTVGQRQILRTFREDWWANGERPFDTWPTRQRLERSFGAGIPLECVEALLCTMPSYIERDTDGRWTLTHLGELAFQVMAHGGESYADMARCERERHERAAHPRPRNQRRNHEH